MKVGESTLDSEVVPPRPEALGPSVSGRGARGFSFKPWRQDFAWHLKNKKVKQTEPEGLMAASQLHPPLVYDPLPSVNTETWCLLERLKNTHETDQTATLLRTK